MSAPIPRVEFIALIAMMFAGIALSTDAMLPVFPQMAADLTPDDPNAIQLVLTIFVLGMGVGTLFTGPLSDSYGRKPVIYGGVVLFLTGATISVFAQTLETLLIARFLQGLGAAGPRVVAMAVVRDLFKGRQMAQMISFMMIVFTIVPAAAPLVGQEIARAFSWRGIFVLFLVYALVYVLWMSLRLPETLPPEARRAFRLGTIWAAIKEMAAIRTLRLSIAAQSMCMGMLFLFLSMTQQIFDVTFDRGDEFALWFGGLAIVAATSGVVNAVLVVRLGMVFMVRSMLAAQILFSGTFTILWLVQLPDHLMFAAFIVWKTTVFYQAGMTLGNLNAIGMEPIGHIAGIGASVIGSVSTILAIVMVIPVGLAFDGTPLPLGIGIFVMACVALFLITRRGFGATPG